MKPIKNDVHSIAFPAISTGVYHYPAQEAAFIATETVKKWLDEHLDYDIQIIFSCFDKKTLDIYRSLLIK